MIHIFFEAHRFPNLAPLTVKNIKTFEVKFTHNKKAIFITETSF